MNAKAALAAGLIAAATLTAVPANAANLSFHFGAPGWGFSTGPHYGHGWRGHGPRRHMRHALSPRDVRGILRQRGFRHIAILNRAGPVYQVRARKRGQAFYLVVSARNGAIVALHRV